MYRPHTGPLRLPTRTRRHLTVAALLAAASAATITAAAAVALTRWYQLATDLATAAVHHT